MQKLRHAWPWIAILVVVCALLPTSARAQGGYAQGGPFPVFKYVGGQAQPASGATITVCPTSVALVGNPPGGPICPSQENDANCCFSDLALTQRLNGGQPFPADSRGNVTFTAVPGAYQLSITGSGILSYTETVSVPCVPGNSAQCGAFTNAANNWTVAQAFVAGLQAGSAGTPFVIGIGGTVNKVAGIQLINAGFGGEVGNVILTTQAGNFSGTNLLTNGLTALNASGEYSLEVYIVVSRPATSSSTLPALTLSYTDGFNSTPQTISLTPTDSGNNLTTVHQATFFFYALGGTTVQLSASGYASSGATSMQFAVNTMLLQF